MVRRSSEELLDTGETPLVQEEPNMRETCGVRRTLEELGVARCPICNGVLVARLSRAGPIFFCACAVKRKRAS